MKLEVTDKKQDVLFGREVVHLKATFEGQTPSRLDIKKKLATQLKVDADTVIVRKVDQGFGEASVSCEAYVYAKKEDVRDSKKYVTKNVIPEAPKEEPKEEKKEEAAPEAKAEEAKEAPAEEAKKETAAVEEPEAKAEEAKEEVKE
jgi:small subunit ribosomal protein S24e